MNQGHNKWSLTTESGMNDNTSVKYVHVQPPHDEVVTINMTELLNYLLSYSLSAPCTLLLIRSSIMPVKKV